MRSSLLARARVVFGFGLVSWACWGGGEDIGYVMYSTVQLSGWVMGGERSVAG